MDEIVVDGRQVVAMVERVHQLLAHAHQRRGAAGRQIEPAKQFLPARLGGGVHLAPRSRRPACRARRRSPVSMRAGSTPKRLRQRLEEGDARPGGELAVAAEDFARQRHAGGLAAAGQQVLAQLDQAFGAGGGLAAPVARQQRAAALGNGLQQFPEERGVHFKLRDRSCGGRSGCYLPAPIRWSGNHVAISGKKHKITIANIIHRT